MIHKEGKNTILITIVILLIINIISYLLFAHILLFLTFVAVLSVSVLFIVLQFFRNPKRSPIVDDTIILSPADGKIVVIEKTFESEYFKDERLLVSVFMSLWNVHVNRYPISGTVRYFKYHKGKYLIARNPKSSLENERTTIVIKDGNKREVLFRQIAGIVARRIVFSMNTGDKACQGEECGFIKFGSRVDLFLPIDTDLDVKIGDTVKSGLSKIGGFQTNV